MHPYEIAVVAHKDRWKMARELATRVDALCLSVDDGGMAQGFNHLRAWRWLRDGDSEWCVVLEDDAKPSSWFLSGDLTDVLKNAPSPVVSLYLGRGSPRHWQPSISQVIARDASWLMCSELLHHVGVAIKASVLPVLLDGMEGLLATFPIDEAIGLRCRRMGIKVAYCKPSIVDHKVEAPPILRTRFSSVPTLDPTGRAFDEGYRTAWLMADANPDFTKSQVTIPEPSF